MLFFDIDDTLTDSIRAHQKAIIALAEQEGLSIENNQAAGRQWLAITDHYLNLFFQKKISLNEQRNARLCQFWKSQGKRLSMEKAEILYPLYHQLFLTHCLLFDDVYQSLVKVQHLPLAIISNGVSSDQLFKLANNGISHFFSALHISEDVGYAKPQKEIFELAIRQTQYQSQDCTYVGNSYELDYLGAKNSGLKGIWINRLSEDFPVPMSQVCSHFSEAVDLILDQFN